VRKLSSMLLMILLIVVVFVLYIIISVVGFGHVSWVADAKTAPNTLLGAVLASATQET
jgi:hypothetical protein